MIIKCRKCGKEFSKAAHRNQHEKDAHKPKEQFKPIEPELDSGSIFLRKVWI